MSINNGLAGRPDCANEKLLNPFVHHLELDTTYEKVKTALLTIILLPIRVFVICCFLIAGWLVASAGLWGLTEEELLEKPLSGWRSRLKVVLAHLIRVIFIIGGFRMKIIGNLLERDAAPVVALAPHSSFVDCLAMVYMGGPSIVAKGETANIPLFGKLINFTQPIYVFRDDPDSRHNTIKEIIKRATSKLDWPQILIFPEGTCTNRSCLITFKAGAFYPGVPVQPVCIRYPNKIDTVTWTWDGPGALKLLWLTLTRPYSYCEIEFLPVYTPNDEEKRDPKLFANNVRKVMAKALGVPISDYTYDDCKLLTRAKEMNLPQAISIMDLQKLRHSLGMACTTQEEALVDSGTNLDLSKVSYNEFAKLLNIPPMEMSTKLLFSIYNKDDSGIIDMREYLLCVLAINQTTVEAVNTAFKIYDQSGQGRLRLEDFIKAVHHTLALTEDTATDIFHQVDINKLGYITFNSFMLHAEGREDLENLLYRNKEEKFIKKHGQFCPPDDHGRKRD
ncbi:lysophosphatidylcholine acyltransferase isoform X2 [Coccinella septempunctata]|uniref:lysophosphatidylcholine acyltransferase isoform X2 n=1 Tax=Coccinella septempunctata TaxID=41139 RepID=UPI001D080D57|nr:lysophosphatidylcholine acyltransferase isoform X2 [Coccinella septempunctata]